MHKLSTSSAIFLAATAAVLACGPAGAAKAADYNVLYQRERAACMEKSSAPDRAVCLQDATAALAEARRGRLDNGDTAAERAANAVTRCKAVKPEDRNDCERMARGEGVVSGSVEQGAVVKQIVTRTVGPVPASPSMPASASVPVTPR